MGVTKQRKEILGIVQEYDGHPTVEDIYGRVKKTFPNIGMGTVYRNLNILADGGEIQRIQVPNEPVRFDKALSPHDHIICVKCGTILDIETAEATVKRQVPANVKFLRHSLFVYCICSECLKEFKYPNQ